MARHASTYRQARRKLWNDTKPLNIEGEPMTWFEFNGRKGAYDCGSIYSPNYVEQSPKPSKYVPHIGEKQRAKGAAK